MHVHISYWMLYLTETQYQVMKSFTADASLSPVGREMIMNTVVYDVKKNI